MAKNVAMNIDKTGKTLTITVDLTKTFGPSKSGKTIIIATTEGNADIPGADGVKMGLNIYKSA